MRIAVAASALLHLGLIVFTMIAWPGFTSVPPTQSPPSIDIELVPIADETNIRPDRIKEEKPPPPKEDPKPKPPEEKPELLNAPPPAPKPAPEAEVEPEPEAAPPEPEKEPEPEKKPEPKPEKKPEPKPKAPEPKPETRKPPKEKDVFGEMAALLDKTPREEQQERVFHEEGEDTLAGDRNREGVGLQTDMTVSMLDALKPQVERCWEYIPGRKNAGNIKVGMVIYFNSDGTLRAGADNPHIKDQMSYATNSVFKAIADEAVRAIRACEGSGYRLPPGTTKVDVIFDPSKMEGVG